MTDEPAQKSATLTSDRLNFILAICAILISAASFYATYLQANSAEKQVKAMTLPLIQYSHGNYDQEQALKVIDFELNNAGVGPAIIKKVAFQYRGKEYPTVDAFIAACCETELNTFIDKMQKKTTERYDISAGGWVSQPLSEVIIPGQSIYNFKRINYGENTHDLWNKLNDERWPLKLKICYCSLIDECFETEKNGVVKQVEMCPVE